MKLLPDKPIHGFTFKTLLDNALVKYGYFIFHKQPNGSYEKRISDSYWELTDEDLEKLLSKFLSDLDA